MSELRNRLTSWHPGWAKVFGEGNPSGEAPMTAPQEGEGGIGVSVKPTFDEVAKLMAEYNDRLGALRGASVVLMFSDAAGHVTAVIGRPGEASFQTYHAESVDAVLDAAWDDEFRSRLSSSRTLPAVAGTPIEPDRSPRCTAGWPLQSVGGQPWRVARFWHEGQWVRKHADMTMCEHGAAAASQSTSHNESTQPLSPGQPEEESE